MATHDIHSIPLHLLQGLFIVLAEFHSLPHPGWLVGPLNGLHVQVDHTCRNRGEAACKTKTKESLHHGSHFHTSSVSPPPHPPLLILTIMLSDCGISTVSQGAGLPAAQTSHIVLIPTKRVFTSPEGGQLTLPHTTPRCQLASRLAHTYCTHFTLNEQNEFLRIPHTTCRGRAETQQLRRTTAGGKRERVGLSSVPRHSAYYHMEWDCALIRTISF